MVFSNESIPKNSATGTNHLAASVDSNKMANYLNNSNDKITMSPIQSQSPALEKKSLLLKTSGGEDAAYQSNEN